MLKWFFAHDRPNYSRHFITQQKIKETHPKIYDQFMLGNFSVKRADGIFNKLPPDQVIEQTINKEQKGAGGIIDISTSDGAVQRWVLSSHITAGLLSNFKQSWIKSVRKQSKGPREKMKLRMTKMLCKIATI